MKLVSGNSNMPLAEKISSILGNQIVNSSIKRFKDGEIFSSIDESVRGQDVFLIQSTSSPVNDNLMELFITADAIKRASARRLTAVIPYFGYARQDRRVGGRTPISAKLVTKLIEAAGIDRAVTLELHSGQIQGFFDIPTDNLFGTPIIEKHLREQYSRKELSEVMIVSPDVGGVVRARALANRFGAELAIVDKRREKAGVSEVMNIIGDVKGRQCILFDDIADSAGTLCNAAAALKERGASNVSALVIHGVLSNGALSRVEESQLDNLVITDTIMQPEKIQNSKKIITVSAAPLIAEAIRRIANEESVMKMFD